MKKKKIQPLKQLREWRDLHKNTLTSFLTNFIATVLGIVLTFGTSMWYERRQNRQEAEALVERCLTNMESRLKDLDGVVKYYDQHKQVFDLVSNTPLDSVSEEDLFNLINLYTSQYRLILNHAYEKSFSQSVNSHEILGSFAEVIGAGFEYLLYAEQNHQEINELKKELRRGQILDKNTYWDKGNIQQVVAAALADPRFMYFREEFSQNERTVRHVHSFLHVFIPEARRLWKKEISDKQFWDKTNKVWDEWGN